MVMAYQNSATYDVRPHVETAPAAKAQFTTFGQFSKRQFSTLFDAVEADLAHMSLGTRLAKRFYLDGIRNRLVHGAPMPNPPCVALRSHLRILPNGDIPTCQFNSKTIGNLRQDRFEELWYGSSARRQRRWVDRCAGCWAECEVVPNAIYTLDLLWQGLLKRPHSRFRRDKASVDACADGAVPFQGADNSTRASAGSP
jgi:hypothetical protein